MLREIEYPSKSLDQDGILEHMVGQEQITWVNVGIVE